MSASLVGSEMCIRDSQLFSAPPEVPRNQRTGRRGLLALLPCGIRAPAAAVAAAAGGRVGLPVPDDSAQRTRVRSAK
eukprot:2826502-Alexandrium_andersonii.AAC.1